MQKFDAHKLNKLKKVDNALRLIYLSPKNLKSRDVIDKDNVKEIIVIATMMIGDTIMLIPSLKVIRKNFKNSKITLLCSPVVKMILYDQAIADEFKVIKFPWLFHDYSIKTVYRLVKSIFQLKNKRYDIAIDFRGDWRNIFLMNFISSERKISFDYSGGEYMLTDVIQQDKNSIHYIDEWLYLLKKIGCSINEDDRYPSLQLSKDDKYYLAEFKKQFNINTEFIIGIHPGASMADRKWSESSYAQLLILINKTYKNCRFVLFEGPGEAKSTTIVKNILNEKGITVLLIKETLIKYKTLLNICNILICNDSGAGHLAGAYGIPTVSIFGQSDPDTVKPYNKGISKIISGMIKEDDTQQAESRGHGYYLSLISVNEVFSAVSSMMSDLKAQLK